MKSLEGRVAVVTGSGKGIGAAVAKRLAEEGAKIAVIDLKEDYGANTVDYIKSKGGEALAVACDVSKASQIEEAVNKINQHYGQIDILINVAGVTRDKLIFQMEEEDWDLVLDTHLKGSFLMIKAVQKFMVKQNYGKIVNTSSLGSVGKRGQANYSSAKAALKALTRTAAIELGRYGINVNCVAPGFIETDMTRATIERMGKDFEEVKKGASKMIPLGRVGQPEDVANVVAFLVSEQANYISGEVINISGGSLT
ncbi:3-oxoacyl-ACP reductase FabG [Niallia oryzisoli]|uniref:3-oxoacyl-ACP reductase FabG n=1 Tax=Niallia oryzisoli TaxID=1737571 RepID=A0ABZ2CF74_9BACI